ncbi:MAG TPA: GtrA family protein [Rugosimonospora sp.]|nr:GtrA family protein [Rugosimonospora sp.]
MSREDRSAELRSTGLRGRPATVVARVLRVLPEPVRVRLLRHREVLKFFIVGGTCFLVTVAINYALKLTILANKPVTALTVATILATVLSYVLNREWSFRTRGGRERHHEAALFFAISAAAVGINDLPMWFARYVLDLQAPHVSRLTQEISDFTSGIVLGTLLAMVFRLWAYRKWVFPKQNVRLVRSSPAWHSAVANPSTEDSETKRVA